MKTSDNPKILAIIPARGGSKSIPRKNIIDVCGNPLIYYSIREAHKSARIDATIVSTDDEEIAAVARSLDADVPFLRPADIAHDASRDIEFLQHALAWVEEHRGWKPEILVYLLPTTPSRTAADIDTALELMEKKGADSVRTMVHPPHFNPYKMWVSSGEGGKVESLFPEGGNVMPRQSFKRYFMPVGAVYATRSRFVKEGRVWGDDVRMIEFPLERFTDIDNPEDLAHTSEVLRKFDLI